MAHIKNIEITGKKEDNKYKFYNLLFTGRISMKEYLNAMRYMENSSKKNV